MTALTRVEPGLQQTPLSDKNVEARHNVVRAVARAPRAREASAECAVDFQNPLFFYVKCGGKRPFSLVLFNEKRSKATRFCPVAAFPSAPPAENRSRFPALNVLHAHPFAKAGAIYLRYPIYGFYK